MCGDRGIAKLAMVKNGQDQPLSWFLLAGVQVFTTESVCLKQNSDLSSQLPTTSFLSQSATTLILLLTCSLCLIF